MVTFSTAKEQVQRDVEKVSLRQAWDTVKQNKPLLRLGLSSLLFLRGMFALETTAIYYARYVSTTPPLRRPRRRADRRHARSPPC